MSRTSKRFREMLSKVDVTKTYSLDEAIVILKGATTATTSKLKFDETVELALKLGVDPRKPDQQVRGTVSLPNGTGKTVRILVLAKGEKLQEALNAGADFAGNDELVAKIAGGWTDFDAMIATPDMMRDIGRLGKVLGPRGLMPSPKAGTVTTDVAGAVRDMKGGKVEFKVHDQGMINKAVGKISFKANQLGENIRALIGAIARAKPASAKGQYLMSLTVSSTMGPGLKVDLREFLMI